MTLSLWAQMQNPEDIRTISVGSPAPCSYDSGRGWSRRVIKRGFGPLRSGNLRGFSLFGDLRQNTEFCALRNLLGS